MTPEQIEGWRDELLMGYTSETIVSAYGEERAESHRQEINALCDMAAQVPALQARIDALMLEYCPDEMTEAQKANWAAHQKPYVMSPAEEDVMRKALLRSAAMKEPKA